MSWQSLQIELVAVTKLMEGIAAIKGVLEGVAIISDTVGQVLETLSPIALLQKASLLLVDKSALAAAIVALITSMNKDVVEMYPFVPIHPSDRSRPPDSLLTLFIDSLSYRHLGTVGAYVPGITSSEDREIVTEAQEIEELGQLDSGLGVLQRFSGFVMLVGTTSDNYDSTSAFFRNFLLSKFPGQGRVTRIQPRMYSWGKLITPITIPSGRLLDPVWRAISSVLKTTGVLDSAKGLVAKLKRLGQLLQEKAAQLRAIIDEISKLQEILSSIPNDLSISLLVFSDADMEEMKSVFFSDGRPGGTGSAGFMVIAADPGISSFISLIKR